MHGGTGSSSPDLSNPAGQGPPSRLAAHLGLHAGLVRPPPHSASSSTTDFWHQKNTDYNNSPFYISQCFVLKLSELQAVNVGLFDQYFRLTGEWPLCFVLFWGKGSFTSGFLPSTRGCVIFAYKPVCRSGRKRLQELLREQSLPSGSEREAVRWGCRQQCAQACRVGPRLMGRMFLTHFLKRES